MDEKTQPKRRGRKPKGGKVVTSLILNNNNNNINDATNKKTAVIVHLKCNLNDISIHKQNFNSDFNYNPIIENVQPYSDIINDVDNFETVEQYIKNTAENTIEKTNDKKYIINKTTTDNNNNNTNFNSSSSIDCKLKYLNYKLDNMEINNISSACFWCSYDFNNTPIHIPNKIEDNNINVYGCFCSPECALAYLLNQSIDDSIKLERQHLLNYIYGKIFDYTDNIKPALNPHYSLKKFFGNLTIEEYRNIKQSHKKYILVDKPLTLINPELNEDPQQNI